MRLLQQELGKDHLSLRQMKMVCFFPLEKKPKLSYQGSSAPACDSSWNPARGMQNAVWCLEQLFCLLYHSGWALSLGIAKREQTLRRIARVGREREREKQRRGRERESHQQGEKAPAAVGTPKNSGAKASTRALASPWVTCKMQLSHHVSSTPDEYYFLRPG